MFGAALRGGHLDGVGIEKILVLQKGRLHEKAGIYRSGLADKVVQLGTLIAVAQVNQVDAFAFEAVDKDIFHGKSLGINPGGE